MSYDIPNDSLYFCISNHDNYVMIHLIFRELLILKHFFNFYFLNMDISFDICFSELKFSTLAGKILFERRVSQNVD